MRRSWSRQRVFSSMLAAGVVALALATALPHRHDAGSLSHTASACRICKLQENAAAAPSAPVLAAVLRPPAAPAQVVSRQPVRPSLVVRLPASRAPPASS